MKTKNHKWKEGNKFDCIKVRNSVHTHVYMGIFAWTSTMYPNVVSSQFKGVVSDIGS